MIFELSKEEIEILESFYQSASGESAGAEDAEDFALLEKLGIRATEHDLYERDPTNFIESHRQVVESDNAARRAYKERHPDWESWDE